MVALLTECVDRNQMQKFYERLARGSHSLRSAWIEIDKTANILPAKDVALLTECVDRNLNQVYPFSILLSRTPYGVRG